MGKGISVVIPTKGRAEQIGEVMDSLKWQSHPIEELIFVDDSSESEFQANHDTIMTFIGRSKPSFSIIHIRGRSVGAADARNQGADLAKGEFVSFIDDDVVLERDYYLEVIRAFSDPEVSGVTGIITNYHPVSSLWTIINRVFFLSMVSTRKGCMRRSGFPCFLVRAEKTTDIGVMSGSNMSYRTDVFAHYHFDERLRGYSYLEDADLSYRISLDHRLVLNPRCRLVHNSTEKGVNESYHQVKLSYHRHVFKKHFSSNPLNYIPYCLAVMAILADAATRSLYSGNKSFIRAALRGLSKEHSVR